MVKACYCQLLFYFTNHQEPYKHSACFFHLIVAVNLFFVRFSYFKFMYAWYRKKNKNQICKHSFEWSVRAFVRAFLRVYGCALCMCMCYILSSCNGNDEIQWNTLEKCIPNNHIRNKCYFVLYVRENERKRPIMKYIKWENIGEHEWEKENEKKVIYKEKSMQHAAFILQYEYTHTNVCVSTLYYVLWIKEKNNYEICTNKESRRRREWFERILCQDIKLFVVVAWYAYTSYIIHLVELQCVCMRVCVWKYT